MTASLSGVFSVQQFTDAGLPASSYRLYTYASGTTTHKAAYIDAAGSVSHTYTADGLGGQFIALNARGELPAGLFLTAGPYDLCLKTPAGATVWTRYARGGDDAASVADAALRADLADTSDVAKGDALIGVKSVLTGAVARTQHSKNSEFVSVLDFGAVLDGVTDDTAAINAATMTGRPVLIPYTAAGCVCNDAAVRDNMTVFGERQGSFGGTMLIVTAANKSAFKHTASTERYNVSFSNLSCKSSSPAFTGTSFWSQTDKSHYLAYATFENIETWGSLTISYDGYFIFTDWVNCRDGYFGTAGTQHTFITSLPVAYGQTNQTNLCSLERCKIFNSVGGSAAIDIAYGAQWSVKTTDFESLSVQALRARAMINVSFEQCWFETITAAQVMTLDVYPATGAGAFPITLRNCWAVITTTTAYFANVANALCQISFEDFTVNLIPAGVTLTNSGARIGYARDVQALSGAGAAGFLTGMGVDTYSGGKRFLNGAVDSGSGAAIQASGIQQSAGFTSTYALAVTTSAVQIATVNSTGGMAFVNAYNTSGGASGWWLVAWNSGGVATTIASLNNTTLTIAFTVVAGALKMNTAAGTLSVSVALLV